MKIPRRIDGSVCHAILQAHIRSHSSLAPAVFYPQPTPVRYDTAPNRAGPSFPAYSRPEATSAGGVPERASAGQQECEEAEAAAPGSGANSLYLPRTEFLVVPYGSSAMTTHRPLLRAPGFFNSASNSLPRRLSGSPAYRTKEELLDIVGQYDDESADQHFDFLRDIYRRGYAPSDGPTITVSDGASDSLYPLQKNTLAAEEREKAIVQRLRESLLTARTKPDMFDPQATYEIYLCLPEPRMLYISGALRHIVMRHMVERPKTHKGMLRYFSLVSDIKECGLSLTTHEWNSAIAYASRYVGTVTEAETEAALRLWREMDREGHVKASEVTFNILFDVATKSKNFALSEMIYKEMVARGLPFNRYHHVSLIQYFGLKMDSGGVRAAYREMVESGEMIDTTVLNCVISGLLRCGEEVEAERVYEKMKETHPKVGSLPRKNYFTERIVTKVLMMFAKMAKQSPPLRPLLQAQTPISPNLQTYQILVNHFAFRAGDLPRVTRYLDEMKHFAVPLHGSIFLAIFKGFHEHGGSRMSDWSPSRLDHVLTAFIEHFDSADQGLFITRWMVMWILKAFARCFGNREKVVDVYVQIKLRCEHEDLSQADLEDILYKTLKSLEHS